MDIDRLYGQLGVPIWQHRREFVAFCKWIRSQGYKSVLELGTGFGGSAFLFGEVTDHGKVVTVDWGKLVAEDKRKKQTNPNFVQIHGDSRTKEVAQLVEAHGPFDLVYFDGEHSYTDALTHYVRYAKLAKHAIAQHDVNMDIEGWRARGDEAAGIPVAWQEFTEGKFGESFVDPDPDPRFPRWGGIGVVFID